MGRKKIHTEEMAQLLVYIPKRQVKDLRMHLMENDETLSSWARRAVKRELYARPAERGEDAISDLLAS